MKYNRSRNVRITCKVGRYRDKATATAWLKGENFV